jgi:hypothetical protein
VDVRRFPAFAAVEEEAEALEPQQGRPVDLLPLPLASWGPFLWLFYASRSSGCEVARPT